MIKRKRKQQQQDNTTHKITGEADIEQEISLTELQTS